MEESSTDSLAPSDTPSKEDESKKQVNKKKKKKKTKNYDDDIRSGKQYKF